MIACHKGDQPLGSPYLDYGLLVCLHNSTANMVCMGNISPINISRDEAATSPGRYVAELTEYSIDLSYNKTVA
jgi:hypothetical protein